MDPDYFHDLEIESMYDLIDYFVKNFLQDSTIFDIIKTKYPTDTFYTSCPLRHLVERALWQAGACWGPHVHPEDFDEQTYIEAYNKFINMLFEN